MKYKYREVTNTVNMDTDKFKLQHIAIDKIYDNRKKLIDYILYSIGTISTFVTLSILISMIILRKKECGTGWIEHKGTCYKLEFMKHLEWRDALSQCDKEYSSLVQITDKDVDFFNNISIGCFWMKNKVVSNYTSELKSGTLEMSFTFPVVTCTCYENNKIIPSYCDQKKPYVCYRTL